MGELVLAAKVSHVPSLMLSEVPGSPLASARKGAVDALRELGRRARERRVSTFVVFDTHWLSNFGYHINANPHHRGSFTSHEALPSCCLQRSAGTAFPSSGSGQVNVEFHVTR